MKRAIQESRNGFSYADRELVLDYIDRELDRMEQRGKMSGREGYQVLPPSQGQLDWMKQHVKVLVGGLQPGYIVNAAGIPVPANGNQFFRPSPPPKEEPLRPIPAGKKTPKDDCGKEWAMTSTTQYGLYPNGWDEESAHVPGYILNETGRQLRDRVAKAFIENDLAAMKEFCDSFIRLDDIPLSSPWFDTSGGRLQGRIKYTLNEKAKPVVEFLRDIAAVKAESKKEFVELAQKSLKRIDAIIHPKTDE
jgi:hypothetical protein